MNDKTTMYEFVMECFSFPYSREYFEILTEACEYQLYCQYVENTLVRDYTYDYLAENGLVLEEGFFQEDTYFQEASETPKTNGFFSKIFSTIEKAWKKFYGFIMRFFKGQKVSLNTKDPKTFRETLKNTKWTNELILKMMETEKRFDEEFWSQQPMPPSKFSSELKDLDFASDVSTIRKQNFKKFCAYILATHEKAAIRLDARTLVQKSGPDAEKQQNINAGKAASGARAASVGGIAGFFDRVCHAKGEKDIAAARKDLKRDQDDVEKNGLVFFSDVRAIEQQEASLKKINEDATGLLKQIKKSTLDGANQNGKIEVSLPGGSQLSPGETNETVQKIKDAILEVLPCIGVTLAAVGSKRLLDSVLNKILPNSNGGNNRNGGKHHKEFALWGEKECQDELKKREKALSDAKSAGKDQKALKPLEKAVSDLEEHMIYHGFHRSYKSKSDDSGSNNSGSDENSNSDRKKKPDPKKYPDEYTNGRAFYIELGAKGWGGKDGGGYTVVEQNPFYNGDKYRGKTMEEVIRDRYKDKDNLRIEKRSSAKSKYRGYEDTQYWIFYGAPRP